MPDYYHQDDNEEGDVSPYYTTGSGHHLGHTIYTGCEIPRTGARIPDNSFVYEHKKCRLCTCNLSKLTCTRMC